jgi:dTDP-4-dehydrorhamnose 3,5-epimerase
VTLSGENKRQFWVPAGFAHGYYVTAEDALFTYKCTDFYHPENELAVAWNDPEIGIQWPLTGPPTLSEKDAAAAALEQIPPERLPAFPKNQNGADR